MDRDFLLADYHPRWLGRHLECHDELPSTNDAALDLLNGRGQGAHGAVVFADGQTEGRGRFGRAWHSPRGMSMAVSVALWPRETRAEDLALLPIACALAVHDSLERTAALASRLKWPNDVLCGGRKISGSIAEARWQGETPAGVVLGIGVNLNQRRADWPQDLASTATSILEETGRKIPVERVAAALLEALERLLDESLPDPRRLVHLAGRLWDHDPGDRLEVQSGRRVLKGRFVRVDESGALVLDTDEGRLSVRYGDARKLRSLT